MATLFGGEALEIIRHLTCFNPSSSILSLFLLLPTSSASAGGLGVSFRGWFHTGSQVTRGPSVQSHILRAWELGLTTSHMVPSPKYDVDVYMATLFGGEALKTRRLTCFSLRSSIVFLFLLLPPSSASVGRLGVGFMGRFHTGSQVTRGPSIQSHTLRAWKLGFTTSHGVPSTTFQASK